MPLGYRPIYPPAAYAAYALKDTLYGHVAAIGVVVYAGINLLFNFGMAFTTRIPVLKIEKAGYFFSPVNCYMALSESATAANAYSRMEASYSAIAWSRGLSPRCTCSN